MRLRTIAEGIERQDFFDFYTLMDVAYTQPDNPEVLKYLTYYTDFILKDHLSQIADILLNRVPDIQNKQVVAVLAKYGVEVDDETYQNTGMEKLSIQQKAAILDEIRPFNQPHGFTGTTWFGLDHTFQSLLPALNGQLLQKIFAIDKVHNLLHHGGQITDYMDESDWLEDALNYRESAGSAQLFAKASPNVRALIGRAVHAHQSSLPVGDLQKLYTSLRRAMHNGRNKSSTVDMVGDKIVVRVKFHPLLWVDGDRATPWHINDPNDLTTRERQLLDCGQFKMGDELRAEITVHDDGDNLVVSGGGGSVAVRKPINRQFKLALDLVSAAHQVASGRPVREGSAIGDIKNRYYYKNKRPVK